MTHFLGKTRRKLSQWILRRHDNGNPWDAQGEGPERRQWLATTAYLYQGNTTKVTDPAGKWKTYTTDAMGNLTKVTEPNPAGGADLDTNYTYNLFNRLTQTSMTRSSTTQTRTFNYDNTTQRLMSVAHPESGTVTYTYNGDGTVATKIDAKNQKIAYTYDSYKRVTQIQRYPVSTGAENTCQRVYFWYDTDKHDPNNLYVFQLQNGWGRVTSVEWYVSPSPTCSGSGTRMVERFSYTSAGLVIKKRLQPVNSTSWPSDAGGGISTASYMEAVYTYNNLGQMVSVKYPGDTRTSGPWRTYTFFLWSAQSCRSAARYFVSDSVSASGFGFRVAAEIPLE